MLQYVTQKVPLTDIAQMSQVHRLQLFKFPSWSPSLRYTLYTSSVTDLHLPLRFPLQGQSYTFYLRYLP